MSPKFYSVRIRMLDFADKKKEHTIWIFNSFEDAAGLVSYLKEHHGIWETDGLSIEEWKVEEIGEEND